MLDWIEVDVIGVAGEIVVVADRMLPSIGAAKPRARVYAWPAIGRDRAPAVGPTGICR